MDPRQEQLPLYQTELKKQLPGCCNIAIRLWIPLRWNTVLKYTCCSSSLFISGFYLTSELFSWLVLSPSCWSSVLLHVHHTAEHISLSSLLLYIHRRSPYLSASKLRRRSTDLLCWPLNQVNTQLSTHLFAPLPTMTWPSSSSQSSEVTPIPKMPVELVCFPPKIPRFSLAPNPNQIIF